MTIGSMIRSGKSSPQTAQVGLQPPHHDRLEILRPHYDAAGEPLRVQHLQQCRAAIRVPVVRGGRQEQPMLEAVRELAGGPAELARDGVANARRRGGVVRLVEDEKRPSPEFAEHISQPAGVGLVRQQAMRDDEPRSGVPRIYREAALPPQVGNPVPVYNLRMPRASPVHRRSALKRTLHTSGMSQTCSIAQVVGTARSCGRAAGQCRNRHAVSRSLLCPRRGCNGALSCFAAEKAASVRKDERPNSGPKRQRHCAEGRRKSRKRRSLSAGPTSPIPISADGWRRGWDSNPRCACTHAAFRVRCFRPLSHLSRGCDRGGGARAWMSGAVVLARARWRRKGRVRQAAASHPAAARRAQTASRSRFSRA